MIIPYELTAQESKQKVNQKGSTLSSCTRYMKDVDSWHLTKSQPDGEEIGGLDLLQLLPPGHEAEEQHRRDELLRAVVDLKC